MKKFFILFVLILAYNLIIGAQTRVIQGVVHTLDSIPLEGVQIQVKSTGQTYLSDISGIFVVECDAKDKLKLRANGFYNKRIQVSENIKFVAINMKIKPGNEQSSYTIGYGSVKESESTGAISGISYKDIDFTKYRTVSDLIRDNFAGVQVVNGSFQIRGSKSLVSDTAPLIVIDGVISEMGLNDLHPLDVKWVNVIKDGTTAVYGSRGTNGVIMIETKKGGEK